MKDLIQPAGTKLFGEYIINLSEASLENSVETSNILLRYYRDGTYTVSNSNSVFIYLTDHGFSNNDNVYVEFTSGLTENTVNAIYMVSNVVSSNLNTFNVAISSIANTSGEVTIALMGA